MIPERSPHERTGYGLRYKGDVLPGTKIGPMKLPATYSKKSDEINKARAARRKYIHLVSALFLVFSLGCASAPTTWHDRMVADACKRCPHCCTTDGETRTDADVIKLCQVVENHYEDCELALSRKKAQ